MMNNLYFQLDGDKSTFVRLVSKNIKNYEVDLISCMFIN